MLFDYNHKDIDNRLLPFPVGKVVCIGQNYADHIAELNSIERPEPLFFIKPNTTLTDLSKGVFIPKDKGPVHNELELAVLIQHKLTAANAAEVEQAIWGYGLALDLTLRSVQARLKAQGRPWETSKAFDGSCPMTPFIAKQNVLEPQQSQIKLLVNGQTRQDGNTAQMLRATIELIQEMTHEFTLLPGDIVLTGTPAGVGPLNNGDELELSLSSAGSHWQFSTKVY